MLKSFALIGLTLVSLSANAASVNAQQTLTENRLVRLLKRYPDSDADKDGRLSQQEALKYIESHPDLKAMRGAKPGDPGPATTAASDLTPGPRVFVCAHSFMIYTSALLPPMAESAGIAHGNAGKQMIGGSRVLQHWNLADEDNKAKAALREGKVDVLTLSPHLQLPDEGIDHFTRLGLEKNAELKVLVQASWPPRDGNSGSFRNATRDDATIESLREQRERHDSSFIAKLETQVRELNMALGKETVCIIPVSNAVFALRERIADDTAPGLKKQSDLFRDDLGHPQPPLAVLVTYCHFAAIHQRTPVGLSVPAALEAMPKAEELNTVLQQIAWDAVSQYPLSGVTVTDASASQ